MSVPESLTYLFVTCFSPDGADVCGVEIVVVVGVEVVVVVGVED